MGNRSSIRPHRYTHTYMYIRVFICTLTHLCTYTVHSNKYTCTHVHTYLDIGTHVHKHKHSHHPVKASSQRDHRKGAYQVNSNLGDPKPDFRSPDKVLKS